MPGAACEPCRGRAHCMRGLLLWPVPPGDPGEAAGTPPVPQRLRDRQGVTYGSVISRAACAGTSARAGAGWRAAGTGCVTASVTRLATRARPLPALVSPSPAARPRRPVAGVRSGCVPCVAAARRWGSEVMLSVCVVGVVHDFLLQITIADCRRYIGNLRRGGIIPVTRKSFPGTRPRRRPGDGTPTQEHLPGQRGRPGRALVTKRRHARKDRTGADGQEQSPARPSTPQLAGPMPVISTRN
jgi:hypothetical protein